MIRRLLITTVITVALLVATNIASGASTSAYSQMKTVIADAAAESSVRVTATATTSSQRVTQVTDAGASAGRQTITLTRQGYSNTVTAELIAGKLYVKGDATILVTYMGFSKSVANELANSWFEITKRSSYFAQVAQGLTISTGMAEVTMTKTVSAGSPSTLSGVKVDVLKGTSVKSALESAYPETMYFSTTSKPLPVEVTQLVSGHLGTLKFSQWNEKISLTAPKVKYQLT